METAKVLYRIMIEENKSLGWIEEEYGLSKHYIIKKVHQHMMKILREGKK